MIRHTVLFVVSPDATSEQMVRAKEGMSMCYFGSGVLALDFGEDLGLEPTDFRLCLTHDHRDREAWDAYNDNDAHHRAGEWIKNMTVPGRAARVDWLYDGPPSHKGGARHTALYRWAEGVSDARKAEVRGRVLELRMAVPSVRALMMGDDLGWYPPNYHWIVETHFDDVDGLREWNEHPAQREVAALLREVSAPDGIAQTQHRMLAG